MILFFQLYLLWEKYCNYPLTTARGDRFASCENIASRSQTSSLPATPSVFFFRGMHARGSDEAARRAKRGRSPRRKKRDCSFFSCLSRLAPSVTRMTICVSRVLLKERLLVVYGGKGSAGKKSRHLN